MEQFFRRQSSVLLILALSLLSFVVVRLAPIPLTDICFFGVAMCCLAAMQSAASRLTVHKVVLSLALLLISIATRRIGIALIPPMLWILLVRPEVRGYLVRLPAWAKFAAVLLAAVLAVVTVWLVYQTSTLRDFRDGLNGHTISAAMGAILSAHLRELGEIALNAAAGTFSPLVQRLLPLAGGLVYLLAAVGVVARRGHWGPVDVFFAGYSGVIFVWPFYDPRFWLPVIPLLFAYSGLGLGYLVRNRVAKAAVGLYLARFALIGFLTLSSNVRISHSGSLFGDAYPDYHSTYCAAGYCKQAYNSATAFDPDALHVLQTYR